MFHQTQHHPQGDQVVLRTVVQVALHPAPLTVHLRHRLPPGGRYFFGVCLRRAQLPFQLNPKPAHRNDGA
jgi:hypothetical protein